MTISSIYHFAVETLALVPRTHWLVMGILSLAVAALSLIKKKTSVYGAIALGITAFISLLFLEMAVVVRYCGLVIYNLGVDFKLDLLRVLRCDKLGYETLYNIFLFVPYGFFFSEYLTETGQLGAWRKVGYATLAALALSMFIECLQLVFRVGLFEMTDLVMNVLGGFAGAMLAFLMRKLLNLCRKNNNDELRRTV